MPDQHHASAATILFARTQSDREHWLYLKERYLSHRLLDDYEAIVDAISDVWNRLMAETGCVKSLCTHPWIEEVII